MYCWDGVLRLEDVNPFKDPENEICLLHLSPPE